GYFFPLTTVKIEPEREEEPACPTRVSYRGEVLADFDRPQQYSFPLRGHLQPELLKIETLGPTGWIVRNFRNYGEDVKLETVPTVTLYVDNQGHGATSLECGELQFPVSAHAKERRVIVAPREGVPIWVDIDGKPAGALDGEHLLTDTLGTRSYQLREIVY